ncbi:MAG TPA: aminotransferase class I/II-fold pyridoxal phosphate-dependent enzyme [Hyphomicrobiaceae bacterium]|nr:aminotransferase class I/II-fold pyridoxal phosphate-dependent enzyme [Hyphomicrobiaceae bacterium]
MTVTGIGEIAPSAGLAPRVLDLFASPRGPTLEQAICAQLALPDIEIVSSGTAALLVALTWLKRQSPRRKVIIPAYTCPLVVRAVASAGLVAVPCDTVAAGFELDARHLDRLLDRDTLAVVPTHYGGVLTDVAHVTRVARARSPEIAIIEDAAQAFGATWQGRSVGLAGDIGLFSFGAGKGFTIYEGGGLVAREPGTLAGVRQVAAELASGSLLREAHRALLLAGYHAAYNRLGLSAVYGAPKRFWLGRGDEVRAANDDVPPRVVVHRVGPWRKAVGRAALARLPAHLAAARDRFARLATKIAAIPGLKVHLPVPGAEPSATFVFVTLPPSAASEATIRGLWASPLGVTKLFSRAIVDYPHLEPWVLRTETPNARALAATTLTVSTHRDFDPAAEAAVLAALREACAGAA